MGIIPLYIFNSNQEIMKDKLLDTINHLRQKIGLQPISNIKAETKLKEDLDIDSISYIELVVMLEEHFNLDINENGICTTVGEILDKLHNSKK